jgi:tRNA pseudouridine55 synthase
VTGSLGRAAGVHHGGVAHGLVVVDKPAGMTSHDVVARLRKVYGQRGVGHAGTLDPSATGVLLVGLGDATRLLRFLQETTKGYVGTVVFGSTTDSLDADGVVTQEFDMRALTEDQCQAARRQFIGDIEQIPPMVSAIKVDGKRLHELAREGKEIERKPRAVRVDRFDITSFRPGTRSGVQPEADIAVDCSSGTYIRSLAADLGTALGGGAHLRTLRRTRVGSFTLADAHALTAIEVNSLACVHSPLDAMRALERVDIAEDVANKVANGNTFSAREFLPDSASEGPFAVVHGGRLIAVYERRGAGVKPAVVLASEARR